MVARCGATWGRCRRVCLWRRFGPLLFRVFPRVEVVLGVRVAAVPVRAVALLVRVVVVLYG